MARFSATLVEDFDMLLLLSHNQLGPSFPPRVSEVAWSRGVRVGANVVKSGRRVSLRLATPMPSCLRDVSPDPNQESKWGKQTASV